MKKLSRESGFTLVEIIVAVGMLGIVSLGVMQLMKNMQKGQVDVQNFADYTSVMQEFSFLVSNPKACKASLSGLTFMGSQIKAAPLAGIELWTADQAGIRSAKKFYEGISFGKVNITSITLSMPDYTSTSNWDKGTNQSFTAELTISGKKNNFGNERAFRDISKSIYLTFDTDASGVSTIKDCGSSGNSTNSKATLVVHSQSLSTPSCPDGWISQRSGYSYVMGSLSSGYTASEDLGDVGSCLGVFGAIPIIECVNNQCDYYTGGDFSGWLDGGGGSNISRCTVCTKNNVSLIVKHSQSTATPTCASDQIKLWEGYSLVLLSLSAGYTAPQKLGGTGSCLSNFKNGLPITECSMGGCTHVTAGDYSGWLTARVGMADVGPSSPPDMNQISRCVVCESNNSNP